MASVLSARLVRSGPHPSDGGRSVLSREAPVDGLSILFYIGALAFIRYVYRWEVRRGQKSGDS